VAGCGRSEERDGGGDLGRGALVKAADTLTWALRPVVAAADPRVIVLGGGLMADGRPLPRLVGERWPAVRPRWPAARLRAARCRSSRGADSVLKIIRAGCRIPVPSFEA
jgi:predicted NBD/HSP70 family sugar kinase